MFKFAGILTYSGMCVVLTPPLTVGHFSCVINHNYSIKDTAGEVGSHLWAFSAVLVRTCSMDNLIFTDAKGSGKCFRMVLFKVSGFSKFEK